MEQAVMSPRDPPEVRVGAGKSQISLKGKEAIQAAGWTLRFLLVAKGIAILIIPACCLLALRLWFN
jgi:hypothetical protein